jgi:DNA-binding GntR family transcriptional regulator
MDKRLFESIDNNTGIKCLVYRELKNAIIKHKLKPGDRITETKIAEQMRVSHTPIREALRDLAKEGLVEIISNKGYYIASLCSKDVEEIYSIRESLEKLAVEIALKNQNEDDIDDLEKIALECVKFLEINDLLNYNHYDSLFHSKLIQLSGNKRLEQFYDMLKGQIQLIMYNVIPRNNTGKIKTETPDHFNLITALRKNDVQYACEIIENHIRRAKVAALNTTKANDFVEV